MFARTWTSRTGGFFRNSRPTPRLHRGFKPGLEQLEERTLLSTIFVVPSSQADGKTKFATLPGAVGVARAGDIIQIEPNSVPGSSATLEPVAIQGDPNFGPSTLPLIPSITVQNVGPGTVLQNLDVGDVNLANGSNGTTITHCLVGNITEEFGPLNTGGSNTISQNVITEIASLGDISGDSRADGITIGDQVINNTFAKISGTDTFPLLILGGADKVLIQGNSFTTSDVAQVAIDVENSTASILDNAISLPRGEAGFPSIGIVINGGGGLTRATVKDNSISTQGGDGMFIGRIGSQGVLQVDAEANDLVHNGVALTVDGNGAGSFDDFGSVEVFSGNDFHGYTASSPAIVVADGGGSATTTDSVFAEGNIFSVSDPSKVVKALGGKVDVSNPLTPNQAFVERLYETFLKRQGSFSELNGWVALLPKLGQAGVASDIIHSAEADARLVDQLYLQYLGRPADPLGESFSVLALQTGHTEEDVIVGLLSSNEFFNRAPTLANPATPNDRNADFIRALYETLLGRAASAGDVSAWKTVLATSGRAGVVNGITHSQEYRTDQVTSFYLTFLHRSGSATEIASWTGSSLDLISIELGFAGSKEFFTNG